MVNKDTYEEHIDNARKIPIKTVKRLGTYSPLRRRPIVITIECYGDVKYLLANKKQLGKGVFADKQYGEETEGKEDYLDQYLMQPQKTQNSRENVVWKVLL